ncbi:PAS domain-containing sensor histidine kinase [Desulfonatronum parangueonense]
MSKKKQSQDSSELRECAEEKLRRDPDLSTKYLSEVTGSEKKRIFHELSVHRVELELQNEELRQTQEKLEAERARYQDLYDFAPMGYLTVDEKNQILEANLTAATLLEISRQDLIHRKLTSFILPEDQDAFLLYRRRAMESDQMETEELRMLKQDGTWFWAYVRSADMEVSHGRKLCRIAFSDNTARKREQEEMARTAGLLDAAGKIGRFGGWSADLTKKRVYLTSQAAEIRGKPEEQDIPLVEAGAFYPPEWRKLIGNAFRKCAQEGVPYDVEVEMFTGWGERIWVRNIGEPIRDASGAVIRIDGSIQDITRQKQAEKKATQTQVLLERAGHLARFGGWSVNLVENRLVLTAEVASIYGLPPDFSPTVEDAIQYFTPKWRDRITEVFGSCAREGICFDEEMELVTIHGDRVWVRILGEAVRDASGAIVGVEGAFQDITESKRAEEEILRVKTMLEQAGRVARFGGWSVNFAENRVYWTDEVADIHEVPRGYYPALEEGINFYAPEWRAKIAEAYRKCVHEGIPYDEEMEIITGKGNRTWIRVIGEAVLDDSGSVVGVEGGFQDISERKRAEEEILRTHLLLEQSGRLARFGSWFVNVEDQKVFLNPTTKEIHGFPADASPSVEDCIRMYAPEWQESITESLRKCTEEGVPFDEEMELIVQGERRWVRGIGEAVRDASGNIVQAIGSFQDISEQKQAEMEILRVKTMLERAASMALFGGWSVDVSEERLYVSGQASEIYGLELGESLTPEEAISRYVPEWQQTITDSFYKCAREGLPFDVEVEIINKRGNRIWIRKTGEAIRNESGKIIRVEGAIQDITDRVQDKEALVRKNQQLQTAIDEKDKFFSIIAHDLKSPLAGFMALTRMLTDEFNTLPLRDLRRMAAELSQATETMYNLLKNLLEWSLMQRGLMTYNPVISQLADLIENNIELFQTTAGNKNVFLQSDLDQNLMIYADKQMMDTVIRNLISNAIKFSMSGGTVFITAAREKDMAIVSVRDEGTGMDEEHLSNLFILIRKKSLRGTQGELGSGLGLLLCKDFVDKHGGKIWVESQPGKGSTFSFSLPIADGVDFVQ